MTVAILGKPAESIPVADRLRWLRQYHRADVNVRVVGTTVDLPEDYNDPDIWDQWIQVTMATVHRAAVLDGLDPHDATIDVVFTSEVYGDELAWRLGVKHVCVDQKRNAVPVSATAIRAGVVQQWQYLSAPVRQDLALRVIVVGAESTGTTTLSQAITQRLRSRGGVWTATNWVPEYGRHYTLARLATMQVRAKQLGRPVPSMEDLVWVPEDFVDIAQQQLDLEDQAAANGSPIVVGDTDAFATGIWAQRYLGHRVPQVEEIGQRRRHDLYLVTDHTDVPFVQDGIRDGESLRDWMTELFVTQLRQSGTRWGLLRGSHQDRLWTAMILIDNLLAEAWHWAAPMTSPAPAEPWAA